jgi:hypothetical protein
MTIPDAIYVTLAEYLSGSLPTDDHRLARAPGISVPVRRLPSSTYREAVGIGPRRAKGCPTSCTPAGPAGTDDRELRLHDGVSGGFWQSTQQ